MAKTYSNAGRQANTRVDATTAGRGETRALGQTFTDVSGLVCRLQYVSMYIFSIKCILIYIYTNALFWQIKYLHILTFVLFISEVCDVYAS